MHRRTMPRSGFLKQAGLGAGLGTALLLGERPSTAEAQAAAELYPLLTDYGVPTNGTTDATAAINSALSQNAGKTVFVDPYTFRCSGPLNIPQDTTLIGIGRASRLRYTGSGTFIDVSNRMRVGLHDLQLELGASGQTATALRLSNAFRCHFRGLILQGSDQPGQTGLELRNNAGDNHFIGFEINNLGVGIKTSCIMNYLHGGSIGHCRTGVWGDSGSWSAGLSCEGLTFVSRATITDYHVRIDTSSNLWWFSHCWFEGAKVGVKVGSSAGGPYNFGMANCKIAASETDLWLARARETYLANVVFQADPGARPVELRIDSGAADGGTAINLHSEQNFAGPAVTWPRNWTVLGRNYALLAGR